MKTRSLEYRLALKIICLATRYLPQHVRANYEIDFQAELVNAEKKKESLIITALSLFLAIPDLAIIERGELVLIPTRRSKSNRFFRAYFGLMVWVSALGTLGIDLLMLGMPQVISFSLVLTLGLLHGFTALLWAVVYKGLWIDVPWMRVTRLAAALKLTYMGLGMFYVLHNEVTAQNALPIMLWGFLLGLYMMWEIHWDDKRPYVKRGLLSLD